CSARRRAWAEQGRRRLYPRISRSGDAIMVVDAHPHRFLAEIGLRGLPSNSQEMCHRRPWHSLAVLILSSAEDRLMTGVTNSRHAWPDKGVARVRELGSEA